LEALEVVAFTDLTAPWAEMPERRAAVEAVGIAAEAAAKQTRKFKVPAAEAPSTMRRSPISPER
jgi:hypothetical protein